MSKVYVTDVILRDAHQSLIATRMRTEDMLPACAMLDDIGYWSLECWGGATFDACLRFLKEDPWERLSKLKAALPNTRLQMLLRGQNLLGYRHYSDDVVRKFVETAARNGMDVFRIFDALNDIRNLETAIEATKAAGKHAQGTICYTTSPVHDIASFIKLGKGLADLGCDSIAIKDMAGLLTPYIAGELVKALKDAIDLPLHLHCHATAGLAEMCQLKAIEAGCEHVDTALSSWAGGTSHPPTESLVTALRGTDYNTGLDLDKLQAVNQYFLEVRKKIPPLRKRIYRYRHPCAYLSGTGRHDLQSCQSAKGTQRLGPHGRGVQRNPRSAQRPGLSAFGDTYLANRRHPSGIERVDR